MTQPKTYEVECAHDNCGSQVWSTSELDLQCWVTWHIYSDHPAIWLDVIGDRVPDDPRPDLSVIFPGNPSQVTMN